VFEQFDYEPCTAQELVHKLQHSRKWSWSSSSDKFIGLYEFRNLAFVNYGFRGDVVTVLQPINVNEYVFECVLKREDKLSDEHNSYYVSKAYNLQHDLRFVFLQNPYHSSYMLLMIAEKSAEPVEKPDFSVELHYLEVRKHHVPGERQKPKNLLTISKHELICFILPPQPNTLIWIPYVNLIPARLKRIKATVCVA
jgi:hypothetical protein